ncbi:hypothetical protein HYALB_00009936 [Hymenoscyphus albidus]|uniref:Vacuolar protein sorting-associated protein 51 homolog n=1 Tax=Hymenoscyphus albidus TaxID=595503 RepID=A0A9N9PU19_9HELO|nr:hypothetical protein HYALB_00009936 [Hymenoscyphus albidus]
MSTIASPRDSSVNGRRVPINATPTSSSRPSLEINRSTSASPNPQQQPRKASRAALREYYNLKATQSIPVIPESSPPRTDTFSETSSIHDISDVQTSPLDSPTFNSETYTKHVLETQPLSELLRTYNQILTDIRALDAEKKALVYDNYSKLIAATETIRKMRDHMGKDNPVARELDPKIRGIYRKAVEIRGEWREGVEEMSEREREAAKERDRRRKVVERVLETPEKIRLLVAEGKNEQARNMWVYPSKLLERWRERGVGGGDVEDCIEDGEAALRGEPANEKSWVNVKAKKQSKS